MPLVHKTMRSAVLAQPLPLALLNSPNVLRCSPAMIVVEPVSAQRTRRPLGPLHPLSHLQLSTFRPPLPLPPSQRGLQRHRPTIPQSPPVDTRFRFCGSTVIAMFVLIALLTGNYYLYSNSFDLFVSTLPAQIMCLTVGAIIIFYVFKVNKTAEPPDCQGVSII